MGLDLPSKDFGLSIRQINTIISRYGELGRHEAEHDLIPMVEEGILHRVVEEITDGRLTPGERGADLFRVGFPARKHSDIHGGIADRAEWGSRSNVRAGRISGGKRFFPERDFHFDELSFSRDRRSVGESPVVLPPIHCEPRTVRLHSNQARRPVTPERWSLIGDAAARRSDFVASRRIEIEKSRSSLRRKNSA